MLAPLKGSSPMKIDFPYPGYESIAAVDVPDANLMGVFSPRRFPDVDEHAVLRDGIANPIDAPRLRDAVKAAAAKSVLILVDDGTRMTPAAKILPFVLQELHAAGLRE